MECDRNKVWLDLNEIIKISTANSSKFWVRALVSTEENDFPFLVAVDFCTVVRKIIVRVSYNRTIALGGAS